MLRFPPIPPSQAGPSESTQSFVAAPYGYYYSTQVPVTQFPGFVPPPSQAQPPPPSTPGGGFFNGAHNFVLKDATLRNYTINNNNNDSTAGFQFKTHLSKHILQGAEFDSSARHPPPTCHPDTRRLILRDILNWRLNPSNVANLGRILWLNGPAGVGKSSIIQTLAEHESRSPQFLLGATIFFSRPNKRNNAQLVFNTIAYRLGVGNPGYQSYVWDKIAEDPTLPLKSLSEQFYWYIEVPFGQRRLYPVPAGGSLSIYLDGLDECKGQQAQAEVVRLIGQFIKRYPAAPIVWIISSRVEPHIEVAFRRLPDEVEYWDVEVPIASPESLEDVKKVLHDRFASIRETYEDLMPQRSQWPSRTQFLKIVKYSTGMFAFAETLVRFIDDPDIGDPVSQLERIIASLDQKDALGLKIGNGTSPNTFTALDALYTEILSDIHESVWPTTKRLLAASLNGDRYSVMFICNLLGLKQNEAYGALGKLHSVVNIPRLDESHVSHLYFHHASFSDYLQDPTRSGKFCITQEAADSLIWECWFRILREVDASGTNGVSLTWSHDDPELDHITRQEIYEDTRTCWAMELNSRCEDPITGEQLPLSPLIAEAINTVNYGDLGPWMPTGEMRNFLRYVKKLTYRIRDLPVRRIALRDIDLTAIKLGHVAYASCEAFGDVRERNEFAVWEKCYRGCFADASLTGPARFGTSWYLAKGVLGYNTMPKIWNDINASRNSSAEAFIFGSGERCCLFVEFVIPDVETWSYVIPYRSY